ncbi:MAG: helix-turn-helix transcriptional regulator [Planctomycetota bacterium]
MEQDRTHFKLWRTSSGKTQAQASAELGISVRWCKALERGSDGNGKPAMPSLTLRLAMAAIAHRLAPYPD